MHTRTYQNNRHRYISFSSLLEAHGAIIIIVQETSFLQRNQEPAAALRFPDKPATSSAAGSSVSSAYVSFAEPLALAGSSEAEDNT